MNPKDLVREQAKWSLIPKERRERGPLDIDIRVVRRRYESSSVADEVRRLGVCGVIQHIVPLLRAEVPLGVGRAVRLIQRVGHPIVLAERVRRVLEPGCLDEVDRGVVVRRGEPPVVDGGGERSPVFLCGAGDVEEFHHSAVGAANRPKLIISGSLENDDLQPSAISLAGVVSDTDRKEDKGRVVGDRSEQRFSLAIIDIRGNQQ